MTVAVLQDVQRTTLERPATVADAAVMVRLLNIAGDGLPLSIWSAMAEPGQDPWQIGRERAARTKGAFSYRNAVIAEANGRAVGCLIGYPLAYPPEPFDPASTPPVFLPLLRLEGCVAGSWYINALAVFSAARGQGHGARLMAEAGAEARRRGVHGTSLIVADANAGARQFYAKLGYREVAAAPMVKGNWQGKGQDWLLYLKRD